MLNFKTFHIAVEFNRLCKPLCLPRHLKDQLNRAAASIALNLAEGYGKASQADKKRFYYIAMGSVRECQAALILAELTQSNAWCCLDKLAAHLFKLIRAMG